MESGKKGFLSLLRACVLAFGFCTPIRPAFMVATFDPLRATVTVGTRLFCQRPELFSKDTTRPLYAKPQSEHSLTRDTQWVGGSQPTPYGGRLTRGAGMVRSRKPANAGRGHSCTESSSHWFEPAKPNRNPNRTPFHHVTGLQHVEGSSNSRYQVVLPKTRVISQRHNQAPNAPAPTWNRQLLRPNHCSWPHAKSKTWNQAQCRR